MSVRSFTGRRTQQRPGNSPSSSPCVDMVDKIVRLWETGIDEDIQGIVRHLFEHIVYDLDQQRIVDFQLKPWASRFLILRHALYGGGSGDGQAAEKDKKGTKGSSSSVGVKRRSLETNDG